MLHLHNWLRIGSGAIAGSSDGNTGAQQRSHDTFAATLEDEAPGAPASLAQQDIATLLPHNMRCLLGILDGIENVAAVKRGRGRYVAFRGDKEGVEATAKRSFKVQSQRKHV